MSKTEFEPRICDGCGAASGVMEKTIMGRLPDWGVIYWDRADGTSCGADLCGRCLIAVFSAVPTLGDLEDAERKKWAEIEAEAKR